MGVPRVNKILSSYTFRVPREQNTNGARIQSSDYASLQTAPRRGSFLFGFIFAFYYI
jgi:hypothetical protein